MLRLVVLCVIVTLVRGQSTEVEQCRNSEGELPINTYVSGCTSPPCPLPQLQDAEINVIFRAPRNIISMRALAAASVALGSITLPPINYDLGEAQHTCNYLVNTYCPLIKDEVVQYTLRMYIEEFFPLYTTAFVEFRIVDENNLIVFCVRLSIRILPPVSGKIIANSTVTIENKV